MFFLIKYLLSKSILELKDMPHIQKKKHSALYIVQMLIKKTCNKKENIHTRENKYMVYKYENEEMETNYL